MIHILQCEKAFKIYHTTDPFLYPLKSSAKLWFTDAFFWGGEKENSLMKRVNPKKILSPLPQKQPSRRIHATARLVHDDDTTVTDHTDQETQFSFGTN